MPLALRPEGAPCRRRCLHAGLRRRRRAPRVLPRTCASSRACAAASLAPRRRCSAACGAGIGLIRGCTGAQHGCHCLHDGQCPARNAQQAGCLRCAWPHLSHPPLLSFCLDGFDAAEAAMLAHSDLLHLHGQANSKRLGAQAPCSPHAGPDSRPAPCAMRHAPCAMHHRAPTWLCRYMRMDDQALCCGLALSMKPSRPRSPSDSRYCACGGGGGPATRSLEYETEQV